MSTKFQDYSIHGLIRCDAQSRRRFVNWSSWLHMRGYRRRWGFLLRDAACHEFDSDGNRKGNCDKKNYEVRICNHFNLVIRSVEGLTLEMSVFFNSLRCPIYVINSVDNTKLLCYTHPPRQHHSFFFRYLPIQWRSRLCNSIFTIFLIVKQSLL